VAPQCADGAQPVLGRRRQPRTGPAPALAVPDARRTRTRRTGTTRATELNLYIADHPKPFTWTNRADQALAKVNRLSASER